MTRADDPTEEASVSGPLLLAAPLLLLLVGGAGVAGFLLARRVPAGRLTLPVAAARRRGGALALAALAVAATLLVVGTSLPQESLRRTQLVAVTPLAAAAAHALVLLVGELTWPRPRQRVRSARLAVRSVRADAPRGLLVACGASVAVALLACVAGALLADGTGRAIGWRAADGLVASTRGPFPGAFYAAPIAVGVLVVALLTAVLLVRVPHRPATAGADAATDGTLRRAAAHRVLRVSTAATAATAAALLVLGGLAARGLDVHWAVDGTWHTDGPGALWTTTSTVVAVAGALLGLAALGVLLVPARAVRA